MKRSENKKRKKRSQLPQLQRKVAIVLNTKGPAQYYGAFSFCLPFFENCTNIVASSVMNADVAQR